ncbi:restriction endonuclease [Oscillibacter ruminantium]|uniref:restriction endonuclease n=1 Tax=Oscillibacter ruminantium TaxID=1263547 RepID=UPI0002D4DDD3|nr:restriction endonuclease [Oscillibacter ruminantium]
MAKLNFVEKDCFERLFGMSSGYVLDFSNRTFQEFVYEILSFDIYVKYPNLSKAKILRAIIAEYDNVSVGKLLLELMRYMQAKGMVNDEDREVFKQCADIGNRLIGRLGSYKHKAPENKKSEPITDFIDYDKYIKELQSLSDFDESPQSRGFAFEKYLKEFFELNGLQPRGSFKIEGEQIDGSFILHNEVYLLEAKWTSKPIDKGNLVIFNEKVSSKSGFTRGLFISYSGYSEEALNTFASGRTVNVVLMTVQELAIALSQKKDFKEFLWAKVRALAEEGNFNKSIFEIK